MAALIAFGAVFVAELGDKSQLLTLAFATRHRALPVLAGVAAAAAVLMGVSVGIGAAVEQALPTDTISVVAGVLFLAIAAWTLFRHEDGEEEEEGADGAVPSGRSTVATVASTLAVAELGDKTMLVAVALAARGSPFLTWAGAVAGMTAANVLSVVAGRWLGQRVSPRTLQIVSAVLFAVFGVALIVAGLLG